MKAVPPLRAAVSVISLSLFLTGCGEQASPDPFVGNMDDFTYGGQAKGAETVSRVNANGREVAVSEFSGRFVWADYAAPWCQPCDAQAKELRKIEREAGDNVVFLTVMTSDQGGYGDEPDEGTARRWAARTGLNPDLVVAAKGLSAWTIPTHILYSPRGQSLYRSTGFLSADQIKTVLFSRMNQWNKWSETGETAEWMRFGE